MHLTSGLLLNARDLFLDFPTDYSGQDDFIYKGMEVREVLEFLFFIEVIEEEENQIIKLNEIVDSKSEYDQYRPMNLFRDYYNKVIGIYLKNNVRVI